VFDFNPTYAFPDTPGLYPVTLYVSNNWGCTDSLTRYVFVVDEFTMFIPNAFTPDNDGINDVFRFTGYDVDTDYFELLIFDRWGEVVHRTTDFEAGWNGNYNNGEHYVPDGVYLYRIETRSLSTQENKVVEGHVSIIR
jgi:gliding motility-associated-like protein